MANPTSLWRHPDFLKLWTGQTISEMGSAITGGVIPLLALILLDATPLQMGLLTSLKGLPVLLFGIVAGVWVDRLRRRPVMLTADLGRAVLLLSIPLLAALGLLRIEMLYGLVVLIGLLGVFFNTAYQAYLPALIERARLVEGNSKLAVGSSIAEIGGAGLSGVLVQAIGAPFAMLLDGISFLFSAGSLLLIRHREPPVNARNTPRSAPQEDQSEEPEGSLLSPSFWREALEGLRAVAGQPVLRALVGAAATQSFLGNFFDPLYSLFALRELGLSPAAIGFTIALGGISSLVGALLARWVLRRFGLGRTLIGALILSSAAAVLMPLAGSIPGSGLILLSVAQLLGDVFGMLYTIHTISLRQAITPDHLLGRVNSSLRLVEDGIAPLGALTGGVLGAALGVQNTLFIAAMYGAVACLWLIASPIRKLRTIPEQTV
jgi:MFS family permease